MGTITGATTGGSNSQNNTTSIRNTEEGYFLHFSTIGVNLFRGFEAFENNNNSPSGNNNNNNLSLLPLPGFEGGLGKGFNLPSKRNIRGLDPNVVALVNTLTGANLDINYVERESNHVKPIEFGETEVKDPNEWLE